MIVKHIKDIIGTERDIKTEKWASRRLLLKKEGMGFSMHETIAFANTENEMCYKNHLEAVYCVEGEGEIESLEDGKVHKIIPGTLYALNNHDRHILRAKTDLRLVCVFNPPLKGDETHDKDGSYSIDEKKLA